MNLHFGKESILKIIFDHKIIILIIAFSIFISTFSFENFFFASNQKFIWGDEEATIVRDTSQSYLSMLITGVHGESSPEPLYYILHKFFFRIINKYDANILFYHRIVSITASALILCIFLVFLTKYIGIVPTLFSVITLLASPDFLLYSIESRPYMIWLLFITILLFYSTKLSSQDTISKKQLTIFLILCLCLILSVQPGIAQVLCSIFTSIFCWIIYAKKISWKKVFMFCVFTVLPCLLFGIYYTTREHVSKGADAGYGFDLINTGNLKLVKSVVGVFFSFGSKRILDIQNKLLIIGVLIFLVITLANVFKNKRSSYFYRERNAFVLGIHTFAQLALSVPIGVIVAFSHYYFIPRAFIYLVIYRAIFVGIGSYLVLSYFAKDFPRIIRIVKVAAIILSFLIIPYQLKDTSGFKYKDEISNASTIKTIPLELSPKVVFYVVEEQKYDISTNSIRWFFDEMRRNGIQKASSPVTYVTFKREPDSEDWYTISHDIPKDAVPLVQCGQEVSIERDRVR